MLIPKGLWKKILDSFAPSQAEIDALIAENSVRWTL